jgi:hypothetical protein
MKKLFILFLLFIGCSRPTNENNSVDLQIQYVDSAISQSQRLFVILDSASKETDSIISFKVKKTTDKIFSLEQQIDSYKTNTYQLMSTEKLVYRIDTVYIETKKNFWGKEKTSTKVKSDSSIITNEDTLLFSENITDTIK